MWTVRKVLKKGYCGEGNIGENTVHITIFRKNITLRNKKFRLVLVQPNKTLHITIGFWFLKVKMLS